MKEMLYEGKAKRVYKTDREDEYLIKYKTDATAFDGKKRGSIANKNRVNNLMSAKLFELLHESGVNTHFIKLVDDITMIVRAVKIIPIEVIIRNKAAGSMAKRMGLKEGSELLEPVLEFSYKSDELGDPMINEYYIKALNLASEEDIQNIKKQAFKINNIIKDFLYEKDLILVDFKLEFGKTMDGSIILADEISPDTSRIWDRETEYKLDKDRFRRDLGSVEEAYEEVLNRINTK